MLEVHLSGVYCLQESPICSSCSLYTPDRDTTNIYHPTLSASHVGDVDQSMAVGQRTSWITFIFLILGSLYTSTLSTTYIYINIIYIYTDISLTFPLRRYTVYVTNGSLQTFKGWWTIQFIQMPCDHWGLLGFPGWDGIIGHLPRTPRIRPYESPDFLLWNLHL